TMRIVIVAVGRSRSGPEQALFEVYRQRLAWPLTLKEIEERRKLPAEQLTLREGEQILAALPKRHPGLRVVVLDPRGKALSSEVFATKLAVWRDGGINELAFLIGGAGGHGPAVRDRADLTLSLGPMIWPHLLARTMLAEQLYRAQQIL